MTYNSNTKQTSLFGGPSKSTKKKFNESEGDRVSQRNVRGMYDKLKVYNGKKYSGMRIGRSHKWHYDNGIWYEQKLTPDKWQINYQCVKQRARKAPVNSGANIGSGYHWYIIADQKAMKMDSNRYQTIMDGFKFKVGHKRPTWKKWSYDYQAKKSYKEKVIQILENLLLQLKSE